MESVGLPLVMMHSPKNRAQAAAIVPRVVMFSCPSVLTLMTGGFWVYIAHRVEITSNIKTAGLSCGPVTT